MIFAERLVVNMKNKQVYINMMISILAFLVNYGVNLILTPYISKNLPGTYGYVKLAADFVAYAEIITIALNSMASRFISIEYNGSHIKKANYYFSSVLFANIIIALVLIIPIFLLVFKIDVIFNIQTVLINDVRMLFLLSFISFLISIIASVFSLASFVKNRLDITYGINTLNYVLRAACLVSLFSLFSPKIYYIGIASLIIAISNAIFNIKIKKKLLPDITFSKYFIRISMVFELVKSGIWNTIQRFGQILLDGLDTVIANLFIGADAMNAISFGKTMPGIISALLSTMAGIFTPQYTILFAKGKIEELKIATKQAMVFLAIFISIPIGIMISMGLDFYCLWIPGENVKVIYKLSCLSCLVYTVSTPMNAVYNLFTVKNKVKPLSLIILISGVFSTLLVFFLIRYTNLGIYAIVGCSTLIGIIRNLFFIAPYAAKMMNFKWYTFYPEIIKSVFSVVIVSLSARIVGNIIIENSWILFICKCFIIGIMSLFFNILLIAKKNEKLAILNFLKEKGRNGK